MNDQLIDIAELSPFSYQVATLDWILLALLYALSAALYLAARKPGGWYSSWLRDRGNVYKLAATRLKGLTQQPQVTLEHLHQAVAVTRNALVLSIGNLVKASSPAELRRFIADGVIDSAYSDLCSTLGEIDTLRFTSSPDLTKAPHLLSCLEEELRKLGRRRTACAERTL